MTNTTAGNGLEEIRGFYEEAFRVFDSERRDPVIEIGFYPYIGINHTIRIREGRVIVRLAEVCREMPEDGHHALAFILVAKLLRRKVPDWAREIYSRCIGDQDIREKAAANKRVRGRKILTAPAGEVYDLGEIFDELNAAYFANSIPRPVLGWSARRTYRILGHHDSTHGAIVVSRSLDDRTVPRYVVEYVVFHEMLHIHHPTIHANGRRYNHTPAFRRDERKFLHFDAADKWISDNVRALKKKARRR